MYNYAIATGLNGSITNGTIDPQYQEKTVTQVAPNAFLNNKNLQGTLNLSNVTTIGVNAFQGCTELTGSLDLSKVTSLGTSALENSFQKNTITPKTLTLSNQLTVIQDSAFKECGLTSFTKLTSNTLQTISPNAFTDCGIHSFDFTPCSQLTAIDPSAFNSTASQPEQTTIYVNQVTYNAITPSSFPPYVIFISDNLCNAFHEHSTNVYRHPGSLSITIQNPSPDQAITVSDIHVTFVYIGK